MGLQEALAGLLLAGPAHGYQLYSMLEGELSPIWETRQSHLYLTLARMERDGLVTGRRVRQQALPDRQVFELTSRGRALANQEQPSEMVVKLAVARRTRPGHFAELAAAISDEVAGRLKALRELSGVLEGGFQQQALALEIGRRQAEIRWLSSIRDDVAAILEQPPAPKRVRHDETRSERLA
jgi:DNA-binding PadR family transcriptional regulator